MAAQKLIFSIDLTQVRTRDEFGEARGGGGKRRNVSCTRSGVLTVWGWVPGVFAR
jgi:hypothetical protein